jgi:uncharacterized protein
MWFLPKSNQFYLQLSALAEQGAEAVSLLYPRVATNTLQPQILVAKQQAKATMDALTDGVCRTFVTPFDREDIQSFAFHLYRILKIADKINQRFDYRPIAPDLFLGQLAIIKQQGELTVKLVAAMRKSMSVKNVSEFVQQINNLEHQADQDYHQRLSQLYSAPPFADMRDFVLQKDLLQHLDKMADTYRDAANLALQIVLKHS